MRDDFHGSTEWQYFVAGMHRVFPDDKGRLKVAICFNMDRGDSWEWADVPEYPTRFSDQGIRIAVNYVVYAMTH